VAEQVGMSMNCIDALFKLRKESPMFKDLLNVILLISIVAGMVTFITVNCNYKPKEGDDDNKKVDK
jgi:hypothetical protein